MKKRYMGTKAGIAGDAIGNANGKKAGKSVCLIAPLPPPNGGIARWAEIIMRHFSDNEEFTLRFADIAPMEKKAGKQNTARRLSNGIFRLVRDLPGIYRAIKASDIVHLTTSGQYALARDFIVGLFAKYHRVPFAYHLHFGRIPDMRRKNSLEWHVFRIVFKLADAIVVLDSETAKTLGTYGLKVRRLPNAIDLAALPEARRDICHRAVFIGWVIPGKGVTELVEAWASLGAHEYRLSIIGPGTDSYIDSLRCDAGIEFLGEIDHSEAMEHLADSDFLVLPSHTEGFPNVVLEAMALGKAVLATDVGAIPEMIGSECGRIVPAKNVDALGQALEWMVRHADEVRRMGEAARRRCRDRYSVETIGKELADIWKSL